ncbi:hypothetical protein BN1723_002831 [Verticillium longisporum]|uniref:Uncharacterized protein n=1 Tax=Verticillium longisporum TaxID=100787 RepID=A0A0G4LK26_VERLO|nr:hypothetical protein BN1723_002831 [Verticillium longisporum]CRK28680.1 hypothetical protein BN1708_015322 [Verticillium longisporum]
MKVSAILAASAASLAIAAPLTERSLGLDNTSNDKVEKRQFSPIPGLIAACINNPDCLKKLRQGTRSASSARFLHDKRQEADDFQEFQDKLLTCSNTPACAKKLDKLKIPGQVLEPENTKEILDNIGNVQTCIDTAKCRKDLFDQIDELIDGTKKSKRQGIPINLSGVTACLADPGCAKKLIGRQDAQVAGASGEITKRQIDPIALEGVMACLQDPECAEDLIARLEGAEGKAN